MNHLHFKFHVDRASRFDAEDMDYDLDVLHLGAIPRTRLDNKDRIYLQYGVRLGIWINRTRSGTYQEYAVGAGTETIHDNVTSMTLFDGHMVLGLGTELKLTERLGLGIDTTIEPRFSPMIGGEPRLGHNDLCAFAGLFWKIGGGKRNTTPQDE